MHKLLALLLIATLSTLGCSDATQKADQQANASTEKGGVPDPTGEKAHSQDFSTKEPDTSANDKHSPPNKEKSLYVGRTSEPRFIMPLQLQQRRNPAEDFGGRYFLRYTGPDNGSASMNFTKEDHRLIQNGDSLGKWEIDGNNIIVTYDHKGHGTVTVNFKDGEITGENIHENGSTYQWVLERIPQPPAYPDVTDLIDKELMEIRLLQKTMNQFTIEVVANDEQKLALPIVIPAGCVFCPDSPRFQNIVVLRPLVVEKLNDPLPLTTCCANPERPFGPAQSYMLRKLPEDCPIRQMTIELSYSPCSTADCQRRIWAKARQCPIKAP